MLTAVIAHIGGTLQSGHYICYAKHNKEWYQFDDLQVGSIEEESVLKTAAGDMFTPTSYVLIYSLIK